jgi:hypothetical protein
LMLGNGGLQIRWLKGRDYQINSQAKSRPTLLAISTVHERKNISKAMGVKKY